MLLSIPCNCASEDLVEERTFVAGSKWRGRWVYVSRESSVADILRTLLYTCRLADGLVGAVVICACAGVDGREGEIVKVLACEHSSVFCP